MTNTLQSIQTTRGQIALFFDTETSGLPGGRLAPISRQPCTVQLAWVLARIPKSGFEYEELGSGSALVMLPDGYFVSPGAQDTHGISTAQANTWGVRWCDAWAMFAAMAGRANVRIAHNIQFDDRQITWDVQRERIAFGIPEEDQAEIRRLLRSSPICTMELSRDVCQLPPTERMKRAGRHGFKTPKLSEAHKCLTGNDFEGAHDAMNDVRACMSLYDELLDRGEQEAEIDSAAALAKVR